MKHLFKKGNKFSTNRKGIRLYARWTKSNCRECGKEVEYKKLAPKVFCDRACYALYRSKHFEEFLNRTGIKHTEETRKKLRKLLLDYKKTSRYQQAVKKMLGHRGKSSLEARFESIFNELKLPYRFVGDGAFSIERKIPDFINTNGRKIAIEVYYRRHKESFRNGLIAWQNERSEVFKKYGWKIVYLDETMANLDKVNNLIGGEHCIH